MRRRQYVQEGAPLPSLVEFTIKDDDRGDPLINSEAVAALGIASREAVEHMTKAAKEMTALIKADLAEKGLELIDIKFEFGEIEGRTVLIDECRG